MNKEFWQLKFREWCKSYDAIHHLNETGILDEEEAIDARNTLLVFIIEMLNGEIEDE